MPVFFLKFQVVSSHCSLSGSISFQPIFYIRKKYSLKCNKYGHDTIPSLKCAVDFRGCNAWVHHCSDGPCELSGKLGPYLSTVRTCGMGWPHANGFDFSLLF